MEGQINVPATVWDKFTTWLERKQEPEKVEVIPEDYEATKAQRDEYKTKLEAIEREAVVKARVEKFETELKETQADPTLAGLLAGLPDEQAEMVMKQFRALSERVKASEITEEKGVEGGGVQDPKAAFNALVLKYSAEKGVNYNKAFDVVKAENPQLFTAWAVKEK